MRRLYVLTAPRGAGKTTFCRTLAERARSRGWTVVGVLSPAVFEEGVKTGIEVQCLHCGERRLLAVDGRGEVDAARFSLVLGRWRLDPEVLAWGNRVLAACPPGDLLIVDELGPLEWLEGRGWTNGLRALHDVPYRVAVVVVRPELVHLARREFPSARVITLPADAERQRLTIDD